VVGKSMVGKWLSRVVKLMVSVHRLVGK
jgi:hypothetical protein